MRDVFRYLKPEVEKRIITIQGKPGVGKTSFLWMASIYIHQRKKFKDGVKFISDTKSLKALYEEIGSKMGQDIKDLWKEE